MGKKARPMEGSMTLKNVVRTTSTQKSVFRWFINKYTLLERGRLYYQCFMANGFNYAYRLIKRGKRLHVAFQCEHSNAHGKFFITNYDVIIREVEAKEISEGLYIGSFLESDFLGSFYETKGLVMIAFRFLTDCSTSVQYNLMTESGHRTDFDELCHDLQREYLNPKYSDFTFKLFNGLIKAHKNVLCCRSTFFKELFAKDENVTKFSMPDTTVGIMHEVLIYIYSGELNDIKTESMIKVLEVAYLLKIPSLKKRCMDYFEETNSWKDIEGMKFFEYKFKDC